MLFNPVVDFFAIGRKKERERKRMREKERESESERVRARFSRNVDGFDDCFDINPLLAFPRFEIRAIAQNTSPGIKLTFGRKY